jgi:regulator of replication initiation timing
MPLKQYYAIWKMNVRLKEDVMKLVTENYELRGEVDYLKRKLDEVRSELVVQQQMNK